MNEGDNPSIGIVLCADKSESVVKYTLPENETQIFASKYKLYLPSEEELLRELKQEYQALEFIKTEEENIDYISVILWGYVLIWYACGDGVPSVKKSPINQRISPFLE